MKHGHIKISRKMFDGFDAFWKEERVFSKAEAWIDLIQRAAWKEGPYTTQLGCDRLTRGEFVGSLRWFGTRWSWDKMRVRRFFDVLEKRDAIVRQRAGQHGDVYLIVNYDSYQSSEATEDTGGETAVETRVRQRRDKVEAVKAVKQKRPTTHAPSDAGKDVVPTFRLAPFVEAHRAVFGGDPPAGRYGRVFKHLVTKYGEAETLRRWKICLAMRDTYATPEELKSKWDRYSVEVIPKAEVEYQYDDPFAPGFVGLMPNGEMSPLMDQLTAPPRMGRAS